MSSYVYLFYVSSSVCLFSVLCVVITCVLMTYVEHDPMMEIVAKPSYVTLLELVFAAQSQHYALWYLKTFWSFAAQGQRYALRCLNLGFRFAAQGLHYTLRYPLRAGVTHYVAFLWEYYGIILEVEVTTY
jgi:hypothetical protein